jgi:DNA modification methylase
MDYKKKSDFMNKWDAMGGDDWEKWFEEAYRSLKYGGYCIMFSIDRQCSLFKYYAIKAGFEERQSLYWFFISSFPKSADLSKNLDKHFGATRELTGGKGYAGKGMNKVKGFGSSTAKSDEFTTNWDITAPSSDLAKKYDGYKYSICPLKQCQETILIFQKPYKTGSCLHDTLAHENGDKECCCGALNIDGSRVEGIPPSVPQPQCVPQPQFGVKKAEIYNFATGEGKNGEMSNSTLGRFPAQTFIECICDEVKTENKGTTDNKKNSASCNDTIYKLGISKGEQEAPRAYNDKQIHTNPNCPCALLDKQSGVKKGNNSAGGGDGGIWTKGNKKQVSVGYDDKGGCSKILHKCKFEDGEYDLYNYFPKVSGKERNDGCENFKEKRGGKNQPSFDGGKILTGGGNERSNELKNPHPCCKPISLNEKILKLFKTPNPQKILYPFAGVFSEVIGGYLAGFTDYSGCELSEEYIKIGEARFKHWTEKKQKKLF